MPDSKVQDFFCLFVEVELVVDHIVKINKIESLFSEST